jgi:hypothetical protein
VSWSDPITQRECLEIGLQREEEDPEHSADMNDASVNASDAVRNVRDLVRSRNAMQVHVSLQTWPGIMRKDTVVPLGNFSPEPILGIRMSWIRRLSYL